MTSLGGKGGGGAPTWRRAAAPDGVQAEAALAAVESAMAGSGAAVAE